MKTRCGFTASTWIEWRQSPPAPGCQRGRVGCAVSPVTSFHVPPPSSVRKSAAGATPAYNTPGVDVAPGSRCQMRSSFRPESSAKAGPFFAGVHVAPKSSE